MIDYTLILQRRYNGSAWTLDGEEYDGLTWLSDVPKPTKEELDALWPEVESELASEIRDRKRMVAYQQQADPLFFKWQRGEATEQEWKDAVAAVKTRFP